MIEETFHSGGTAENMDAIGRVWTVNFRDRIPHKKRVLCG